ncbi:MAG: GGDEF domain-containing protein [Gammaproteobacteria bacterium]
MGESTDWKKKYLELERKVKGETAGSGETEQLLCRTIIRLTLATKGLDPALDPHLTKLRDALKKGVNENVNRHISAISEALMRAHDEPAQAEEHGGVDSSSELFQRLLDCTHLPGKQGKRLKALGAKLAANPAAATEEQLDEFIHLLASDTQHGKAKSEGSSRLLGRIFGRDEREDASAGDGDEPMRILLSLLAKLNWPSQLSKDISQLGEKLEHQKNRDAILAVAKDLTKIVSHLLKDLNKETRATGSFLADLMARLQELDKFVVSGQTLQQKSLQSGKDLDRAVKDQVGGIATSVRDAKDITLLQRDVAVRLKTIKAHMDNHLKMAEERFKEAEQNEKKLRERLREVENETGTLRHKILEAQARSSMDPVTGLPNRAAYDARLKDEYTRWQRFKNSLVLMVWDLDDFKQVNDRFGHQAGDKALRVIGTILKQRLRQTDFVGRYGGEEFCVLLSGSPMQEAGVVAEHIRKAVEQSGFHSGDKPITLTISCGYTDFREGDTTDSVFERADRAMYQAKEAGKNCCVSL